MKLLVGRQELDAAAPATRDAVAQWSAAQHDPDFPDEFNPAVIDMAKFDALLAALPAENPLQGRTVTLDARRLGIGASSPTTPASFKPPLALEVIEEHTSSVDVRAAFTIDCALARSRAAAARDLTHQAERDVEAAQARRDSGTAARVRRWAVARVWEENAIAAAACTPGDTALLADSEAATKATDAAILLGGSMQ